MLSEKPTYYYVNVNHGVIPSHDCGPILTFRGMGLIFGVVSYPSITHNVIVKSSPYDPSLYEFKNIPIVFEGLPPVSGRRLEHTDEFRLAQL